jgi:hypothetical protein
MKKIETLSIVQALIGKTYMYAIIIGIAAVVLAFIIANLVKYQGGKNPTDHITRRIWYIVVGLIAPISFYLYNALYVSSYITKAPLQAKFSTANLLATLALLGVYVVLGIVTMLIFRKSKWGSILGKSKK